jgi:hypothetical protein
MITRRAFGALALAFPGVMATTFAAAETLAKPERNPPGDIPDERYSRSTERSVAVISPARVGPRMSDSERALARHRRFSVRPVARSRPREHVAEALASALIRPESTSDGISHPHPEAPLQVGLHSSGSPALRRPLYTHSRPVR